MATDTPEPVPPEPPPSAAAAPPEPLQPRAFLADLSTALQPFVPHDRLGIGYLSDDRRTFSVFADGRHHENAGDDAATNRDLTAEMAAGRFRSDLFYRLGVVNVNLPSLRERGDDVLLLADSFIRSLAAEMGKGDVSLSRDARELLRRHAWPGNIRELQNAIERGLTTCEGALVTAAHLAIHPPSEQTPPPRHAEPLPPAAGSGALQELERKAIIDALQRSHGHKSRAAELLGLTRFQLYSRLKRYHIKVSRE